MELYGHLQLFSILLGTFLNFCPLLYECKKLDGYEFPVYSTESCPRNQTEWNERSSAINCTQDNGYLCFPNEKFTQLLEFCHRARFIWILEGYCLYLKKDDSTIYSHSCSSFQSGCHNSSFPSYDLFKHSSCTSIGNGCFLAEPSCKDPDTTTSLPETTEPIHVEIVTKNYITTASPDEKTNQTLKYDDYVIYDEIFMMPILAGVLIPFIIFCMLCVIYRNGNKICKRDDGLHEEDNDEEEFSQFIQQNQSNGVEGTVEGKNQVEEKTDIVLVMTHKIAAAHPFSKGTCQKDVLASHAKAEVSRSVGLIYIDGKPEGTGFRVGDKYIMTCKHVVTKVISASPYFIDCGRMNIEFERKKYLDREDPNKIFDFQPTIAHIDDEYDVVVLELKHRTANVPFPPALNLFGEVCEGEIHLVGHPGGRQMKEDSDVLPYWLPKHTDIIVDTVRKLGQWSMATFPNRVDYYEDLLKSPRKIMFHTTFDKGSSGSPGFMIRNDSPCVILMVRGGTPSCFYDNSFPSIVVNDNQKVEYGYAMSDIYLNMLKSSNPTVKNFASEIFREWLTPQNTP